MKCSVFIAFLLFFKLVAFSTDNNIEIANPIKAQLFKNNTIELASVIESPTIESKYISSVTSCVESIQIVKTVKYSSLVSNIIFRLENVDVKKSTSYELCKEMEMAYAIFVIYNVSNQHNVNTNKAVLYELLNAIEAKYQYLIEGDIDIVNECKSAKYMKLTEWFEYYDYFENGTGLWSIIKRARYMSKKGQDVSELYEIFLNMVKTSLNNN